MKLGSENNSQAVEQELEELKLSDELESSYLKGIYHSVVRDIAIGQIYGKELETSGAAAVPFQEIFTDEYCSNLDLQFGRIYKDGIYDFPLYTDHGDLLSQLARLLTVPIERSGFSEHLKKADRKIGLIGLKTKYMKNKDYVRYLRNSVVHSSYGVRSTDTGNPEFIFISSTKTKINAKIYASTEQLIEIIQVVIEDTWIPRILELDGHCDI